MAQSKLQEKPSLDLTRSYPAAPDRVWRAWTDAETLKQWWGPGDEPVSRAELDVRIGGRFRIVFGGPDGRAHECAGVYREVVPNRKLVFTWTWPNTTPERESLVTITLRAAGKGTELVLRHEQFFDEAARDGHERGWTAAFEKLERFLQVG
jgi:uncharacterized protein YndB with AHSA1/START domain